MRIALVTREFVSEPWFDGGLANYLFRLSLALDGLGHSPVVFVASDHDEVIEFRGIEVHRVEAPFNDLPRGGALPLANKLYRAFAYVNMSRRLNAYLGRIHAQNPFDIIQYTHLAGIGLLRHRGIPSVVRLSSYTQGALDAYELKGFRQQHIWEHLAMLRMDGIFGPSQLVCSILEAELRRPVRLIESPFLLDIEADDPSIYARDLRERDYLLYFGSIGVLKGIRTIAKALPTLFEQHPNLFFVFVGRDQGTPDGKPLVPHLYDMAGRYKDRVIYLGQLRHEQLYPIIRHSIAVVLPSRIENFSNACVEAMALRQVVIGTRGTSFEQLIDDGMSGFLCEVDNEISLLEAVDKVMALAPDEREQIQMRAWERIQELRPEIVVNQLLDYYSEIIALKKHRSLLRQV